ncbi:MAG: 2-dehydropantoate 2-reductase [Deltaproteobacteria bacterium]|nr:2-dehydropantoate 2-reductase [Deltaproteobacteria bacterium]
MKIAVMGAGGIGGYYGGLLARAGHDVTLIARGAHLQALRDRGLAIHSVHGDFTVPVAATHDPGEVGPNELVLFCVKAYDVEAAADSVRPLVGPTTTLLTLQNGIDTPEKLAARFGWEHVLAGLTHIESSIEAPGVIRQTTPLRRIVFGEWNGTTTPRGAWLAGVLQEAGITAVFTAQIQVALWEKFVFICALAGLTTLLRASIGQILDTAEGRALYRLALEECAGVGRARGIPLDADVVDRTYAFTRGVPPTMKSSMLRDLEAGKPLELETLSGVVVQLGAEAGVPTPVHLCIYTALRPRARGGTRQG